MRAPAGPGERGRRDGQQGDVARVEQQHGRPKIRQRLEAATSTTSAAPRPRRGATRPGRARWRARARRPSAGGTQITAERFSIVAAIGCRRGRNFADRVSLEASTRSKRTSPRSKKNRDPTDSRLRDSTGWPSICCARLVEVPKKVRSRRDDEAARAAEVEPGHERRRALPAGAVFTFTRVGSGSTTTNGRSASITPRRSRARYGDRRCAAARVRQGERFGLPRCAACYAAGVTAPCPRGSPGAPAPTAACGMRPGAGRDLPALHHRRQVEARLRIDDRPGDHRRPGLVADLRARGHGLVEAGLGHRHGPGLAEVVDDAAASIGAQDHLGPVDRRALDPARLRQRQAVLDRAHGDVLAHVTDPRRRWWPA